MSEQKNELSVSKDGVFNSIGAFENAQRMAKALATSKIIPTQFQGKVEDILVALEIAGRTETSAIMVMQNLDIIKGKPSWSSKYVISALNSCGRFTPLRFRFQELGEKKIEFGETVYEGGAKIYKKRTATIKNQSCTAYCKDVDGNEVEGPEVTIEMAYVEGWWTKSGSKWPTMTKLMMSYRAAKFFGNLYAPDILMGMKSADEIQDVYSDPTPSKAEIIDAEFEEVDPKPDPINGDDELI